MHYKPIDYNGQTDYRTRDTSAKKNDGAPSPCAMRIYFYI